MLCCHIHMGFLKGMPLIKSKNLREGTHAGIAPVALKILAVDEGFNALLEVALLHGEL